MAENRKRKFASEDSAQYPNAAHSTEELQRDLANAYETIESDPEFVAEYAKASFVEDVLTAMELQGLTRAELADKLGKKRPFVSRVLNEKANFTIDTMAEFACALGLDLRIALVHRDGSPLPGKSA